MKTLVATLLILVSFNSFASNPTNSSVSAFLSILPVGTHSGTDEKGNNCEVDVREANFPARDIAITASNDKDRVHKVVADGSEYLYRGYKKEFIQTELLSINGSKNSHVEKVIRTVIAADKKLYVVVAHTLVVNRDRKSKIVECIVDL